MEVRGNTTVGQLRQRMVELYPSLDETGFELVARPSAQDDPRPREDSETVANIWAQWNEPLCVMILLLWPLRDGESTFPIPDPVKFAKALPPKYDVNTFLPKED